MKLSEARHRGVALEGHDQRLIGIEGLFAQGGEVGADGREVLRAVLGAEAAGDLLLEVTSADVAFGLVVEGHAQIGEEAQDGVTVIAQPSDQVVSMGLPDPLATTAGRAGARVAAGALGEQRLVALNEVIDQGPGGAGMALN